MMDTLNIKKAGTAKFSFYLFLGLGLFCLILYILLNQHLFSFSFTFYLHSYSFEVRNVLLLLPMLIAFSCALSAPSLPAFRKIRAILIDTRPLVFLSITFCVFVAAASGVCLIVLEGIPHIQDSIVQLFQARIFATGAISLPSHEHSQFFDMQYVLDDGIIRYGKYFFGQSLFLLAGVLIGAPWIINPVVGGITIILTYMLAEELYDRTTAKTTVILLLISPFYLFMHASFMSHGPHLMLMIACLLSIVKICTSDRRRYYFSAGICFGIAITVKPYDSILFLLPFALYLFTKHIRKPGWAGKAVLCIVPVVFCCFCLLFYNKLLFGGYFTTGYTLYSPYFKLGFGSQIGEVCLGGGTLPGHTPLQGMRSCLKLLLALCDDLFGWFGLSLMFVCILFIVFKTDRWERMMAISFACVVAGYFFLFATRYSICYGPRYYFVCVPALALMTARGILQCPRLLACGFLKRWTGAPETRKAATALFVALLIMLNFTFYMPRALEIYGNSYWNVDKKLINIVGEQNIRNALIFVESEYYRTPPPGPDYYNSVFNFNTLTLDGPVIYARDFGPDENRILMEYYSDRNFYLYATTGGTKPELLRINDTEK